MDLTRGDVRRVAASAGAAQMMLDVLVLPNQQDGEHLGLDGNSV